MNVHYGDYLQLEKILDLQHPESIKHNAPAHDETLFIIIHQAYELWFKQILHEVDSVIEIMDGPALNDNSPELQTVVHRLNRVDTILKVLVHQIDIMETMTPMDFLDFRDMLRPASGFQSWQFKLIEAKLGLKYEQRHGQEYYISQLRQPQIDLIRKSEKDRSLMQLLNSWLERMPFFSETANWETYQPVNATTGADGLPGPDMSPAGITPGGSGEMDGALPVFWQDYRHIYASSLAEGEKNNLASFDRVFIKDEKNPDRGLSAAACRAALFIMLYRGYPILQLPFQLLNALLDADEQLSTWRYRHINMVHRIIGTRVGTGGSTGKEYLKGALDKHYIFKEIAQLTSFLIERRKLPKLSEAMEKRLGFHS